MCKLIFGLLRFYPSVVVPTGKIERRILKTDLQSCEISKPTEMMQTGVPVGAASFLDYVTKRMNSFIQFVNRGTFNLKPMGYLNPFALDPCIQQHCAKMLKI